MGAAPRERGSVAVLTVLAGILALASPAGGIPALRQARDGFDGAAQARFALLRARAAALESTREAELAEEVGTSANIKRSVEAMDDAARAEDAHTAAAMLGSMRGPLPDDGVMRAPSPFREAGKAPKEREAALRRLADLCAGSGVALDLEGAGFSSLLGDGEAATGLAAQSLGLPGMDGGAEASGAPRPADVCLVPLAVCGEGHSGSLRLAWRRPSQRLNAAGCEPDASDDGPSGAGFLPLASLSPADADFAGLRSVPCEGSCRGLAAEAVALPLATSPFAAPSDAVVSFDASVGLESLPLARRTLVSGLRAALNAAYAVDSDQEAMQKAAAAVAKQ